MPDEVDLIARVLQSCLGPFRPIERYEAGDIIVSTVENEADDPPFETAISHPAYAMRVAQPVELYESEEEARAGHARWVARVLAGDLPAELDDPRYFALFGERKVWRRIQ